MNDFWLNISSAITAVFLAITLFNYLLLFLRRRSVPADKSFNSVTVITPAHNEERHIEACLRSALAADFPGEKEIVVIDDGSTDRTAEIVSKIEGVRLIRTSHRGKAASLNMAIGEAKGELVAIIDGDTEIAPDALVEMKKEVEKQNVVAATCPVTVKNKNTHVLIWLHLELLSASLSRMLLEKVNANIVTSGQFCIFRKEELMAIGGFSTSGFAEDMDVTIRLIRANHHVGFAENAMAWTNMPDTFKSLLNQRVRWMSGVLTIIVRHLRFNTRLIDVYTLPILLFGYIQAIVMGSITFYKIADGYWTYFASRGHYFDQYVLSFLIDWCSIIGVIKWGSGLFTGGTPATAINIAGVLSAVLTYPMLVYAILRFDKKIEIRHLFTLTFLAPFWWSIMLIQIFCLSDLFRKEPAYHIWNKNDEGWKVCPEAEVIEQAKRSQHAVSQSVVPELDVV